MNFVSYLKSHISDSTPLSEIVQVFENMCAEPIEHDMLLFETGTFSFTGTPMFYFSLVRQYPDEEDEYYQIHVDVLYEPDAQNRAFSQAVWNEDLYESIFDYVRRSAEFQYASQAKPVRIKIYLDQT